MWEAHCQDNPLFKDMEYNDRFTGRLRTIRDDFQKKKGRAEADKEAHENFRQIHPVKELDHRGLPRWEGSRAQELLREDMDDEAHNEHYPRDLRNTREECAVCPLEIFRDHICQEQRLRKHHNFLEQEAQKQKDKEEGKGKRKK